MASNSGAPESHVAGKVWPVLASLQSYRLQFLTHDLFAGLTLAAIAIPEQMATARLGGFAPQIGFFAFLAGSLAFAFFGSNRFLSCGADSTITPIFAGGLAALAASGDPQYLLLAASLALMVGFLLFFAGIFRLGWIADLLSIPVTTGFLAGISAAHPDFPTARHSRGCRARRRHAAANCNSCRTSQRGQSVYARDRIGRAGDHRPVGADRRAHSRRLDRACAGKLGRGAARTREPRRQRCRRGPRRTAGAGAAGYLGWPVAGPGIAQSHHRDRGDGADGGDHAVLSLASR